MNDRPPIVDELLDGPYPCSLTTLDRDGAPYSVVVWCAQNGDRITVNAAEGLWLRQPSPRPAASRWSSSTPRTSSATSTSRDGSQRSNPTPSTRTSTRSLEVYEGRPYAYSTPDEVPRFRVEIEPGRIRTLDLPAP